jgi:hypothetical protein
MINGVLDKKKKNVNNMWNENMHASFSYFFLYNLVLPMLKVLSFLSILCQWLKKGMLLFLTMNWSDALFFISLRLVSPYIAIHLW